MMMYLIAVGLAVNFGMVSSFCLWDCDGQSSSSSAESRADVEMEGDNNVVYLLDGLRQAHESHMVDVKMGIFTLLGLFISVLVGVVVWWLCRRYRRFDADRIHRRVDSIVRRRDARGDHVARMVKHGEASV